MSVPAAGGRVEHGVSTVLPELLGVLAFAVSFRHVRHVLVEHGADDVSSWSLTIGVEALAIVSFLERRRRTRLGQATTWPACVLLVGVGLTIACNLETATPGGWGVLVALLGPGLYLLAFSLVGTRGPARPPATTGTAPASPDPAIADRGAAAAGWLPGRTTETETAAAPVVEVVVPVSDWQRAVPGPLGTAPGDATKPRARRTGTGTTGTTGTTGMGTKRSPARGTSTGPGMTSTGTTGTTGTSTGTGTTPDVTDLLVPGRAVARALAVAGQRLTRDNLLAGLQERGHPASTRRAGALLAVLRAEPIPPAVPVHGVPAARSADSPVLA